MFGANNKFLMTVQLKLSQLIDLALATPSIGTAINLQILHAILHIIVKRANLDEYQVEFDEPFSTTLNAILKSAPHDPGVSVTEYNVHDTNTIKETEPRKRPSSIFKVATGSKSSASGHSNETAGSKHPPLTTTTSKAALSHTDNASAAPSHTDNASDDLTHHHTVQIVEPASVKTKSSQTSMQGGKSQKYPTSAQPSSTSIKSKTGASKKVSRETVLSKTKLQPHSAKLSDTTQTGHELDIRLSWIEQQIRVFKRFLDAPAGSSKPLLKNVKCISCEKTAEQICIENGWIAKRGPLPSFHINNAAPNMFYRKKVGGWR